MSTTTGVHADAPVGAGDESTRQVTAYVGAVREALADRPDDEVDDLTGGMEADLTELLAERGGSLESALGSPLDYSIELRSAAGVPPAPVNAPAVRTIDLGAWWARRTAQVVGVRDRHRWLSAAWAFLVPLRPVWWVLRGLALGAVLFQDSGGMEPTLIPSSHFELTSSLHGLAATAAMVVLSVLYGRGLGPAHRLRGAVGAALGVVALVALAAYPISQREITYVDTSAPPAEELSFAGQPVDNVYVYDRDGRRLEDVRLFDAAGRSLVLQRTADALDQGLTLPGVSDVYGQWWTNVFPRPWTVGGTPYARNPQGDPSSPVYTGADVWSPPPSVAPLVVDPTPSVSPSGQPTASVTAPSSPSSPSAPSRASGSATSAPRSAPATPSRASTPSG